MKRPNTLRLALLLLLIFGTSTLCGCLKSVELNERAIVQAIGIDYDEKEDSFQVSLQIYSPDGSGGQSLVEGSLQNAKIIESQGKTMTEAVQNATLKQGKTIFYGHNRVVIVGESAARSGLKRIVSFFNSNNQARLTTGMLVAKGSASEILKTRINQGILPAEALEKMLDNSRENGKISEVSYLDIVKALENQTDDVVIPAIAINPEKEQSGSGEEQQGGPAGGGEQGETEQVQSIEMSGTAVFRDGKLAGYLDEEETRGLMWLRGDVNKTVMVASTDRIRSFSVEVYKVKTDLACRTVQAPYTFELRSHLSAAIRDVELMDDSVILNENDYQAMEQMLCRIVEQECNKAVSKAVYEYGADVAHFGNLIWQKDAAAWKRNRSRFSDQLSQVTVNSIVTANIDRIGLETQEQGKE